MRKIVFVHLFFVLGVVSHPAKSALLDVNDWIFNIDNTLHENYLGDPIPATGSLLEGLGTLSLEVTGAGTHNVLGFFDFEIDAYLNTFFNEYAITWGSLGVGQSWEIDEPGYLFGDVVGNVYDGTLDNSNNVFSGAADDVSYAMGWSFSLLEDDIATIDFIFTDTLPTSGFTISHIDPDSDYEYYFYSELDIISNGVIFNPDPDPVSVPEPSSLLLLIAAIPVLFRRRFREVLTGGR